MSQGIKNIMTFVEMPRIEMSKNNVRMTLPLTTEKRTTAAMISTLTVRLLLASIRHPALLVTHLIISWGMDAWSLATDAEQRYFDILAYRNIGTNKLHMSNYF